MLTHKVFIFRECEIGPRFASPNDVEFAIAQRWLSVFDEEKAKRNELEIHIKENRGAVKDSIVNIREQHQTELMRQELVHHQQEQMRLLIQLRERDGGMPPSMPGMPLMPTPPHFSADLQEVSNICLVRLRFALIIPRCACVARYTVVFWFVCLFVYNSSIC